MKNTSKLANTKITGTTFKVGSRWYIQPITPGYKEGIPLKPKKKLRINDIVIAYLVQENAGDSYAVVHSILKTNNEADRAVKALVHAYDLPHEAWDPNIWTGPAEVTTENFQRRTDLRNLPFVTIDGETARDFDDAVYVENLASRGWKLCVAIADVAHYVKEGKPIDRKARDRGNSVYFPDRVIPMLPEVLSNQICSLIPNEDRLAVICEMIIDQKGRISTFDFCDAVIQSKGRLTYTEAVRIKRGPLTGRSKAINHSLQAFYDLFRTLRTTRVQRGALDFTSKEATVRVVDGVPINIFMTQQNDAHRMIEEAMIATNVCAARYLKQHELNPMYRVHDRPDADSLKTLIEVLEQCDIKVKQPVKRTSKSIQQLLSNLNEVSSQAWIWEGQVLRAMTQAQYAYHNQGHFGLALTEYAHFTSPIRRYADLYNHRLVKSTFQRKLSKDSKKIYPKNLGVELSDCERRADTVSRKVEDWLKCSLLAQMVGKIFVGFIVTIEDFGVFVELDSYNVSGLIHISDLGDDFFIVKGAKIEGSRKGQVFTLGDRLEVQLIGVDVELCRVDLIEASRAIPAHELHRPSVRKL